LAVNYDTAIEAIETAMASATLTVEYDGRRVTYRNFAEMRDAIAYFKRQKTDAASVGGIASPSADRGSYAAFSRD
jgi:hypothetical protein